MGTTLQVLPGTYYAGFTRPWYASQSAVTGRLEGTGFTNVHWHSRKTGPPPVDPHSFPGYSDDWDEWISADMAAPRTVTLPAMPAWIVAVGPTGVSPIPSSMVVPGPGGPPGGGSWPSSVPGTGVFIPSPLDPVLPGAGAAETLFDPAAQKLLRTAGPSVILAEVAFVVLMGLYAKNRAAAKAAEIREREAARDPRRRRSRGGTR